MADEEFEIAFEGRCQCGDEMLDWDWSPEEMCFSSECGCMKRHKLVPLTAIVSVERNGDEEDLEEEEPDW